MHEDFINVLYCKPVVEQGLAKTDNMYFIAVMMRNTGYCRSRLVEIVSIIPIIQPNIINIVFLYYYCSTCYRADNG